MKAAEGSLSVVVRGNCTFIHRVVSVAAISVAIAIARIGAGIGAFQVGDGHRPNDFKRNANAEG